MDEEAGVAVGAGLEAGGGVEVEVAGDTADMSVSVSTPGSSPVAILPAPAAALVEVAYCCEAALMILDATPLTDACDVIS